MMDVLTHDQVIKADDVEDMQCMVRKLIEEYAKWSLTLNLEDVQIIFHCQDYVYLGITFNKAGKYKKEMKIRIVQAKKL